MKLSVSLPEADVEFIDGFAAARGYPSRSAVVQKALDMLRAGDLVGAYEDAFASWEGTGEDKAWAVAAGDGLGDAPR